MPSHQICTHSPKLRLYSSGCATSGTGMLTSVVAATECTATSGCKALIVSNDSRGIVGISSDGTDSALTIWVDALIFPGAAVVSAFCDSWLCMVIYAPTSWYRQEIMCQRVKVQE